MKLMCAAILAAAALLATGCGGGKQDGIVVSLGTTPVTVKDKDVRTFQTFCPGCKKPIAVDTARCGDKRCKTDMVWKSDYRCSPCKGSGICNACLLMEQAKGECYNCKGEGVLIFAGQSPTCPNCNGEKKCPTCKGSRQCDACKGSGKVPKDVVKAKAAKFVGGEGDNELPPSDARPPVKEEEKKDAPAPEEKKEGAAEEKK
jgi:hypothetical protein